MKSQYDNAFTPDKIVGLARALRDAKEIYKVSTELGAEREGRVRIKPYLSFSGLSS